MDWAWNVPLQSVFQKNVQFPVERTIYIKMRWKIFSSPHNMLYMKKHFCPKPLKQMVPQGYRKKLFLNVDLIQSK